MTTIGWESTELGARSRRAVGAPMTDAECTAFLQWALPRLERRWLGYRKVRKLVCKRLAGRIRALALSGLDAYRRHLDTHPGEWEELDGLLSIPISRFYRDESVFAKVETEVIPALARAATAQSRGVLDCWSAGCASGEEPYTLAVVWQLRVQPLFPSIRLRILGTDMDAALIARAQRGCYSASSFKGLPADLVARALGPSGGELCLNAQFRDVAFLRQDLRAAMPDGPFDLVLCRNVVLTYYDAGVQADLIGRITARLRPGGALVVGIHESLPDATAGLEPWPHIRCVYRRILHPPQGSGHFIAPDASG